MGGTFVCAGTSRMAATIFEVIVTGRMSDTGDCSRVAVGFAA